MTDNHMQDEQHPDLVEEHFQPFVRPLGNLVIAFALAEAELLDVVAEMLGGDDLKAVTVLKSQDAKEQVLSLVRSLGLSGFDLQELLDGVESFWLGKEDRNRLIHDRWFPDIDERSVATRGLTRAKVPQVIFGTPTVEDIWRLARQFQHCDELFSHRAYLLRRNRGE
jgi:hypothetical protein